jgi:predicted DNA-binding protein with PD1-like motif
MKYTHGKAGRMFVVRLEDGEVIHEELERSRRTAGSNAPR